MGGEDHSTAEHRSPLICNEDQDYQASGIYGAMASYQDAKGVRWVLVPFWGPKHPKFKAPIEHGEVFNGAVAAFKMEKDAATGRYSLVPAWLSRAMKHADPPVIENGIVFGYASGEDVVLRRRRGRRRAADPGGTPLALAFPQRPVAIDGQTCQELGERHRSPWTPTAGSRWLTDACISYLRRTVYCFGCLNDATKSFVLYA